MPAPKKKFLLLGFGVHLTENILILFNTILSLWPTKVAVEMGNLYNLLRLTDDDVTPERFYSAYSLFSLYSSQRQRNIVGVLSRDRPKTV